MPGTRQHFHAATGMKRFPSSAANPGSGRVRVLAAIGAEAAVLLQSGPASADAALLEIYVRC